MPHGLLIDLVSLCLIHQISLSAASALGAFGRVQHGAF